MISISTQAASIYHVVLDEKTNSQIARFSRRVSRVATLNGGSVITDSGCTDTDRTLTIEADVTPAQKEILEYLIKNHGLWNVATKNGNFVCAPKNMDVDNGALKLVLYVTA